MKVPAGWAARVLDKAGRRAEPAVPRDAATVMLLRPAAGDGGLEVYMLRRKQSMPFAPGASVFPGGSVDVRDADSEVAWAGPDVTEWAGWLDASPQLARGLLCAAVRETFEESGVLLAGPSAQDMTLPGPGDLEADRLALLDRSLSLAEMLARRGLVLRSDLLKPWARWITPAAEPRRYDTRFFAALLPAGQQTADIRDEADQVAWLRPPDLLAAAQRREVALMPPTAVTLGELAACAGVQRGVRGAARDRAVRARGDHGRRAGLADAAGGAGVPAVTGGAAAIDGSGSRSVRCVLAPNPSPMTLDGTNTWLIAAPGASSVIVVDPGPADEGHLQRVRARAEQDGRRVEQILLTHGHPDHSDGVRRLAELTGAPVQAADPAHRLGGAGLGPGDVLTGRLEIRVVATPGHSADSVCLLISDERVLLTGDTVLGRGTTVIAGDGNLGDYLGSLDRLRALADAAALAALLPGHGPVLPDPAGTLDYYIGHRRDRLAEVRAALAAGDRTAAEIVARVYADVDRGLWPFAEWSVRAQLEYLDQRGELPPDVRK